MVEGHHREHLHHDAQDDRDSAVRVLPQCQLVRVEALEQDLRHLDQVLLQVNPSRIVMARARRVNEDLENLQDVLLIFPSQVEMSSFLLHDRKEIMCVMFSDFQQSPIFYKRVILT